MFEKLKPDVYGVSSKSNFYLLTGGSSSYVIDTGGDDKTFADSLQTGALVLTHKHHDHLVSPKAFSKVKRFILHENTYAALDASIRDAIDSADRLLINDAPVEIGPDVIVYPTQGHCAGSIIVFDKAHGYLFTGDELFSGMYPYLKEGNLERIRKAISLIKELKPDTMFTGHGAPTDLSMVEAYEAYLNDLEQYARTGEQRSSMKKAFKAMARFHEINLEWIKTQV